ncbi:MAG: ANTAR domain-containing protein [Pseudomonadota bacterium]
MAKTPMRIVVVERDRDRALTIVDGLRETGEDADAYEIEVIGDETGFARKVAAIQPDIVLIDLMNPSRDMLEELALASGPLERPVAIFADSTDDGAAKAMIEAGVSAYVVGGLAKERIRPVIDAAVARFHLFSRMRAELEATKAALVERKTVDRAKGLLMRAKGIGEDEAYALLRKTAMDQGRKIGEVAEALVTAADLLK